jgi:filamentous hemagglutinin
MGQATRQEAQAMGEAWVGVGYRVASDGKALVSADGLRVYRPPSLKPQLGKAKANFQWIESPGSAPIGNGHLDIK